MPPDLQVRLLRVLSDGEYYRVGGHAPQKANVRIIAATHQDLEERVRQGLFREDLMHRLNVDSRPAAAAVGAAGGHRAARASFPAEKRARELAVEPKVLSDAALKVMCAFRYPGNVRQLENVCNWLTVMAPGQRVEIADLPTELREPAPVTPGQAGADAGGWLLALDRELARALTAGERAVGNRLEKEFEKALILRALAHSGGHRMEAAQWLGWGREHVHLHRVQELGLEPELKRGATAA